MQSVQPEHLGRGFGARANEAARNVLELLMEDLLPSWEAAARRLLAQKMALDDEINKERKLSVRESRPVSHFVPRAFSTHAPHFCTRLNKSRGRMTIPHLYRNMSRSSIMPVSCTIFSKSMKMGSDQKHPVSQRRLYSAPITHHDPFRIASFYRV